MVSRIPSGRASANDLRKLLERRDLARVCSIARDLFTFIHQNSPDLGAIGACIYHSIYDCI